MDRLLTWSDLALTPPGAEPPIPDVETVAALEARWRGFLVDRVEDFPLLRMIGFSAERPGERYRVMLRRESLHLSPADNVGSIAASAPEGFVVRVLEWDL